MNNNQELEQRAGRTFNTVQRLYGFETMRSLRENVKKVLNSGATFEALSKEDQMYIISAEKIIKAGNMKEKELEKNELELEWSEVDYGYFLLIPKNRKYIRNPPVFGWITYLQVMPDATLEDKEKARGIFKGKCFCNFMLHTKRPGTLETLYSKEPFKYKYLKNRINDEVKRYFKDLKIKVKIDDSQLKKLVLSKKEIEELSNIPMF